MDMNIRSRLQNVIDEFHAEIQKEQDRIDQAHLEEALFGQQFIALKENVVRPAFAELEVMLKVHGHGCRIVDLEDGAGNDEEVPGIRCEFYPDDWIVPESGPVAGPPSITLTCDCAGKTVKMHECTFGPVERGWSGEIGSYQPGDVTKEAIAEAFVAMVEKVLLDKSYIARASQNLTPTWTRPGRRAA